MSFARDFLDNELNAVDQLLGEVGLKHGRRQLMGAGFERQPKHPQQQPRARQAARKAKGTGPFLLQIPEWSKAGFPMHGFSTRSGGASTAYAPEGDTGKLSGEFNLGFTAADAVENVTANRQTLIHLAAGEAEAAKVKLIALKQIHSSLTYRVTAADIGRTRRGDGLMTDEPGLLLAIQTADCVPVLVADQRNRAVAAFHAGWRGTLKRTVEGGIGRMRLEFGSRPEDMMAAIGPGIGQCCYSVGEEVRSEFESQFSYGAELFRDVYDSDPVKEKYPLLFMTARAPGHSNIGPSLHLDLAEANRRQLIAAGIAAESIFVSGECTSCLTDRYFSHRAERGFTGRMMSVVGVSQ